MNRAVRHLVTASFFLLLAACGGGGEGAPPPPATTDNDSLPQLSALAGDAKQQCCQAVGPYMVSYGQGLAAGNLTPGPLPSTGGCQNAVMNFEMQFRTIDNGAYANRPDAQAWRTAQGAGIANCVGGMMQASGLNVGPSNLGDYALVMMLLAKDMQSKVPSVGNLTSYVPQKSGNVLNVKIQLPVVPPTATLPTGSLGMNPIGANPALASATNPFAPGTQVMPFLPPIPAGM